MKKTKLTILAGTAALSLMAAIPAQAHKVIASAYAEGRQIEGEIGFSNGDVSPNQLVEVFAEDGRKLGEATTDGDGIFLFTPTENTVHIFKADLGAGHVAEYRMELDELPDGLVTAGAAATTATAPAAAGSDTPGAPAEAAIATAGLKDMIASAVRKEVKPLRKEIAAYKEKNDLQTILGGIGYIIGIFGLGFFLMGNRRAKQAAGGQPAE